MKQYPKMVDTEFGRITLSRKTYKCDVCIFANRKVRRRKKSIARKRYGTSHKIGPKELKRVCRGNPDVLFIGAGQEGQARLTGKGEKFLKERSIAYKIQPTPDIIASYNRSRTRKAAIVHVTC